MWLRLLDHAERIPELRWHLSLRFIFAEASVLLDLWRVGFGVGQ
jgi:hypothetical protein